MRCEMPQPLGRVFCKYTYRYRVWVLVLCALATCSLFLGSNEGDYEHLTALSTNETAERREGGGDNWRNLTDKEIASLSALGRRLFLQDEQVSRRGGRDNNRTYRILVWKSGPLLEKRLIYQYGEKRRLDPFRSCSVTNCELTYDEHLLPTADAILFHLHRTAGPGSLPRGGLRPPGQRWVFMTDESPYHTFLDHRPDNKLANYDGLFNWSMSYRMDSDVPVPYGRTLRLAKPSHLTQTSHAKTKTKTVAIMVSNCSGEKNKRWAYVKELRQHMHVDVYGGCGTLKCPGHFQRDCPHLSAYKFYLAFENSNCREYLTEKAWWNAYAKGAVPVLLGVSREDAGRLLPPHSYIHTEEFATPGDLARYLLYLNRTDTEYDRYFLWRREYRVVNEHGYFQSTNRHYCRLCEALNYNDPGEKVYTRLDRFWSVERDCRVPDRPVSDALLDALLT